ncbi:MAG: phosphoribosyltransferase [Candidatus Bathyarchaeota archaeon]|nr:MAG: phosphoribosyltransferase [Candidatus Bathyarchaeota archaeon]
MDWELFYSLSEKVARKIIESGYRPDFIVGLARGGWVLSRVLCDFLGVKDLVSLKVEHWGVTATPDGKAQLKYPFDIDLTGRQVLVVDDITDTGESMRIATEYVETKNPAEVRTAALRHITGSGVVPDYFGDEITWRWVVFPWNYVEDMCNLVAKATEGVDDPEEIRARLKEDHGIDVSSDDVAAILVELERRS